MKKGLQIFLKARTESLPALRLLENVEYWDREEEATWLYDGDRQMQLVCSWCGRSLCESGKWLMPRFCVVGPHAPAASYGICPDCIAHTQYI